MSSVSINCQEAATYLGVSVKTIRRWAQNGKLHGKKVGSRGDWRFSHTELDKMVRAAARSHEQKTVEEALQDSEARYRALFNSIDEGFCVSEMLYDDKGKAYDIRFLEVNDVFEEMTAMKAPVGKTLKQIVPGVPDKWLNEFIKVVETGVPSRKVDFSESRQRWYDIYSTRIGGPGSHLFAQLFKDVTAEKQAQKELQAYADKVRSTLESISDMFLQVDADWKIVLVNHKFEEFIKRSRDEIVGQDLWTVLPNSGSQNEKMRERLEGLRKARKSDHFINYYKLYDTWYDVRIFPTEDGLSIFAHDITEQKHAEEARAEYAQLSVEHDELLKVNKAKDEFIGIASHQLRTPATAVKQYIGILLAELAGPLNDKQRKYLETAYKGNERQLKLINDLLKTAQIDAAAYTLHRSQQDIGRLMKIAIGALRPTLEQRKQEIIYKKPDERIDANVDPIEMDLVFNNLLDNASKYSPIGSKIEVTVSREISHVEIAIKDEGVGIRASDQEKIFDKFTRIENRLSSTVSGTGLGLYWVKQIVEMHGGIVGVASGSNKGSIFTVRLPL